MHLTVRMAWHDSGWNGKVCQNPTDNAYCTGTNSLLSGRIEKDKNSVFEEGHAGCNCSTLEPKDIPPCFWSINAFGDQSIKTRHKHPFPKMKIPDLYDELSPYSVYSWPFKLSFNHRESIRNVHGQYPPDLENRIDNFNGKFKANESIIFFYCNYDNPVSADDMRYLLLGCSVLSKEPENTFFDVSDERLQEIRSGKKWCSNQPRINWACKYTHDPQKAVMLPYLEYINHVEERPEKEGLLEDLKIIITEESLISSFKYVAMDIDDDKCLYLLYKIRKAIKKVQEHQYAVISDDLLEEEKRIESLIDIVWARRGFYPSLSYALNNIIENCEISQEIAKKICNLADHKKDAAEIFREIINGDVPDELEEWEDELEDVASDRFFKRNLESLIKLSMLNLTNYQIKKIYEDNDLLVELGSNPYALYECYKPDEITEKILDEPDLQDEAIDIFKIDMAMIPDKRVLKRLGLKRHKKLQNLKEDSPQRIRSVIIDHLKFIGNFGHCYDETRNILRTIKENPLFYKNEIRIDEHSIKSLDSDYKSVFCQKLYIEDADKTHFYFLNEIKDAENNIREKIIALKNRQDHPVLNTDYNAYIAISMQILSDKIDNFESSIFESERKSLYENIFRKSFYLLTGRPGSGKTYETSKVIEQLNQTGEEIAILAPTGKAALRLTENIKNNTTLDKEAETIDRFIYRHGLGWVYNDTEKLKNLKDTEKLTVTNLIIDECSMIDLEKLNILLSVLRFDHEYPKRIIMVGDENQLPPIGFGKPFHDIILETLSDDSDRESHYINLKTNCRLEGDLNILRLAEAFTDRKRYYEEALELIQNEGQIGGENGGLVISKWKGKDELDTKIAGAMDVLLQLELGDKYDDFNENHKKLSLVFGLYESGYVNARDGHRETMKLDAFQMLSPYRSSFAGTLVMNKLIQSQYRPPHLSKKAEVFHHSDKIIRLSNWYKGYGKDRNLILSNGSIGIVNFKKNRVRNYFFKELDFPYKYIDGEENFDLAYTITVHKSQGSDFRNVFLIISDKMTLLSRELIYTALTRSKNRLFLFVKDSNENILEKARHISHLLNRRTAVFEKPESKPNGSYEPETGQVVKSKVEFIIYKALMNSELDFKYEKTMKLKHLNYELHPDFTIQTNDGRTVYWEHLGMLDVRKYYRDWIRRKEDYRKAGLFDCLVTTDDLDGLSDKKLQKVIDDIRNNRLVINANDFSQHHYSLNGH